MSPALRQSLSNRQPLAKEADLMEKHQAVSGWMWFSVYDEKMGETQTKNKTPKCEEHREAWSQNMNKSKRIF